MQDVLAAHPPKPQLSILPLGTGTPQAGPPLLTPPSKESSTSLMMMQGMKSVLQQSGASTTPLLRAPIMPGNEAVAQQRALAISTSLPSASSVVSGVQYQPGQAPKDLATLALEQAGTTASATPASATGGCEPKNASWTKTCVEAGYPETFTGSVQGETHTTCPGGAIQDVWVSNTCAPPPGEESSSTPFSAPMNADSAASNPSDAVCGPANGLAADSMPSTDLCNAGEPTAVTGEGPWRWSCAGHNNGMTVSCAASAKPKSVAAVAQVASAQSSLPPVIEDGTCGSSDGAGVDHAPTGNLCNKGAAPAA